MMPQKTLVPCQMDDCIPEVVKTVRTCMKETRASKLFSAGASKLFSAIITADDPAKKIARGKYTLSQCGPLVENCAFLVVGYVAGGSAFIVARRCFPKNFLHYHRAGHCAIASPETQSGDTAFVRSEISRVSGASGVHAGTMRFGKMKGG